MTKNEALKAAIDGKKVVPLLASQVKYIYFNRQANRFDLQWKDERDVATFNGDGWVDTEWQIVPEYVDFAAAWKAHEEGKTIQSVINSKPFDTYQKSEDTNRGIFTDEIRGKWLILEDE